MSENKYFKPCCDNPKMITFEIRHDPKPLPLSDEMNEAIEFMLLYMPLINSTQKFASEKLEERKYGNKTFRKLLKEIGMNRERDVYIDKNSSDNMISKDLSDAMMRMSCMSCQKFAGRIKKSGESDLGCFLRHVRNSIAHGNFFVKEDMLFGYDGNSVERIEEKRYTSVFRFRPVEFVNAFRKMFGDVLTAEGLAVDGTVSGIDPNEMVAETVLADCFRDFGYMATMNPTERRADILLEKAGMRYFVEYKPYKGVRYLHAEHVRNSMKLTRGMTENERLVFVSDASRITNEVKALLTDNDGERMIVLDKPAVMRLLDGEDVLAEMTKRE